MCRDVSPSCISVHHVCSWCQWRPEESTVYPGTSVTGSCEPLPVTGLGIEPGSSSRTVSTPNCKTIFPAPDFLKEELTSVQQFSGICLEPSCILHIFRNRERYIRGVSFLLQELMFLKNVPVHHINDSPRSIYNIWSLHSQKTPGSFHRMVTDMLGLLHNLQESHLFGVAHMGRLLRRILSWALSLRPS